MSERPILMNTDMVRAILEGRKTVTRRVIKPQPEGQPIPMTANSCYPDCFGIEGTPKVIRPPYQPCDILWVRETWTRLPETPGGHFRPRGVYYYKAGEDLRPEKYRWNGWHPSIHMPREAARIFLRVTDVRVEGLQDCGNMQAKDEGCTCSSQFARLWDSLVKPADRATCGWEANPWVWVISFERISKDEAPLV